MHCMLHHHSLHHHENVKFISVNIGIFCVKIENEKIVILHLNVLTFDMEMSELRILAACLQIKMR